MSSPRTQLIWNLLAKILLWLVLMVLKGVQANSWKIGSSVTIKHDCQTDPFPSQRKYSSEQMLPEAKLQGKNVD